MNAEAKRLRLQKPTPNSPLAISPPLLTAASVKLPILRETWQVFIKSLTGKTYTLDAYPHMMVDDLISQLGKRDSGYIFMASECRFLFGGKQLELHRLLSDYGIQKGSKIDLVLRLHGGSVHLE